MDKLDICPGESDARDGRTGDTNNPNESSTSVVYNTEYYETSELFSPELFNDSKTNSTQNSPSAIIFSELTEITRVQKSSQLDIFLTPIQTSKIFKEDSPSRAAVVPTVPTSLVPFISTVNESWTSDLETPNAETAASKIALGNLHNGESSEQRKLCDSLQRNRCESMRSNAVLHGATTPNGCFVARIDDESFSTSPILQTGNKRHKPKRRILKSLDNNSSTNCLMDITNIVEPTIEKYELSKLDENIEPEIGNKSWVCDSANDNSLAENYGNILTDKCCPIEKDREIEAACGDKSCLSKKIDMRNIENPFVPNNVTDQFSVIDPVKDDEQTVSTHVSNRCDDKIDERLNEVDKKSFGDCLKEIKKLRKNKPQFEEDKYLHIPDELFTEEAEALESAEMSLMVPDDIKKFEKSDPESCRGFISFTQMCLLEDNSKKIEPSGRAVNDSSNKIGTRVVRVGETDPGIERIDNRPENVRKHESMRNESSAMSLEEDEMDIAAIFASSFADEDETVIDVDEFSPWYYQSDETKSDSSKCAKIPGASSAKSNFLKARGGLGTTIEDQECRTSDREHKLTGKKLLENSLPEASSGSNLWKDNKNQRFSPEISSFGSIGFSTACGKPIEVSEDKMRQARKLYDEISAQDGNDRDFKSSNEIAGPENCRGNKNGNENTGRAAMPENIYDTTGFSTAGGKPIKISEEKLKQAEKLYAEVSAEVKENSAEKSLSFSHSSGAPAARGIKRKQEYDRTCELNSVAGFTTACGKPIEVSETAMKRAKLMFDDEDNLNDDVEPPKELLRSRNEPKITLLAAEPESANQKPGNVFSGFTTAGGKSLSISKSALAMAERIYKDLSDVPDAEGGAAATDLANSDHESIANFGDNAFNTGKRNAAVREESSERAFLRKMDSVEKRVPEFSAGQISTGFSTANGVAIRVSEAAISRAEKLLIEEGIDCDSKSSSDTRRGEDRFVGFSSASERKSKWLAIAQESTPPNNSSTKRSVSQAIETSTTNYENENLSVFARPGFVSPFENGNLKTEVSGSALKKSRKVRPSSDLQRRKLFSEKGSCESDEDAKDARKFDSSADEERKSVSFRRNNGPEIYANPETFRATDRSGISKLEPQKSSPLIFPNEYRDLRSTEALNEELTSFSEEVTASVEALLADEENSNDEKPWASAITCSPTITEDRGISMRPIILGEDGDTILEAPPSPILGGKFRLRKKKRRNKKSVSTENASTIKAASNESTNGKEVTSQQTDASCSQSSYTTTSISAGSFKELHRTDSPLVGAAFLQKFNEFSKSTENEAPAEKIFSEIERREAIAELLENRVAAMLEQEKIIRAKKKFKPKPVPGSLLLCKMRRKDSRISLRDLTNGLPPAARTPQELIDLGIESDVVKITAANAVRYRLKCADFRSFNGDKICPSDAYRLDIGDDGRLILDENGFAGAEEFERAFVASPNVDPSLVAQGWVENHYRWIVWKLAAMDRMKLVKNRMLTPDNIMKQLKYRYDREIDRSQRPALRRIIEKDDPACRRMILCVANLTKTSNGQSPESKSPKIVTTSRWKVELTDGWYSVAASVDAAMEHLISSGKVREGTKLVTCGAELLNCDQGCSPLEIPADVSLKIHCNSTRRVRWDAKLGYCRNAAPIPTQLSAVLPYGGLIGKLDAIIARLYPIQYFEKTPSGQAIFRNDKCEDKAATIDEEKRQAQRDAVYSKARADFESRSWKASKTENSSISSIESFRNEVDSILQKSLPPPRKVTPVLKARVIEGAIIASLTVWAPSEDIIDVMKEGNRVSVNNLQSSGRRLGELSLTVGRQSFIKYEGPADDFPRRRLTEIKEIAAAGFNPIFGDFDTVGVVVSFGPAPHGMKNFEVVNLAFPVPDSSSSAYLSILFWDGIAAYGFSDILTIGSTVACVNLQWRRGLQKTIPIAYSTEHSTFTRNPRQVYLRSAFERIKEQITDFPSYTAQCALQIVNENENKTTAVRSPAIHESPVSGNERSTTATSANQRTPQGATINTGEMITPAKYSIQRRLEKLQWYGEPPVLSPIIVNQNSIKVKQKFISPLRTPEKRN